MTPDERKASLERILEAVQQSSDVVSIELQKGADLLEMGDRHGAALELLRGCPELSDELSSAVPALVATAALLVAENAAEALDLRCQVQAAFERRADTAPNHTRAFIRILLDAYRDEPTDLRPH